MSPALHRPTDRAATPLLILLGAAGLLPLPAAAGGADPSEPTLAVLPVVADDPALRRLGALVQSRVSQHLADTGRYRELHPLQVHALINSLPAPYRSRADLAQAGVVIEALGADRAVASGLMRTPEGHRLFAVVFRGAVAHTVEAQLPLDPYGVVARATEVLIEAVSELDGAPTTVVRAAARRLNAERVEQWAACIDTAHRMPLHLDASALNPAGVASCRQAAGDRPEAASVVAALAWLLLHGNDAEAARVVLEGAEPQVASAPLYFAARLNLAELGLDGETPRAILEQARTAHPGTLLFEALRPPGAAEPGFHLPVLPLRRSDEPRAGERANAPESDTSAALAELMALAEARGPLVEAWVRVALSVSSPEEELVHEALAEAARVRGGTWGAAPAQPRVDGADADTRGERSPGLGARFMAAPQQSPRIGLEAYGPARSLTWPGLP